MGSVSVSLDCLKDILDDQCLVCFCILWIVCFFFLTQDQRLFTFVLYTVCFCCIFHLLSVERSTYLHTSNLQIMLRSFISRQSGLTSHLRQDFSPVLSHFPHQHATGLTKRIRSATCCGPSLAHVNSNTRQSSPLMLHNSAQVRGMHQYPLLQALNFPTALPLYFALFSTCFIDPSTRPDFDLTRICYILVLVSSCLGP